jgi:hypothetical protein
MSIAKSIRQFFRDLLGSRLVETLERDISQLQAEALLIRSDYEARLRDRDEMVADLRANIAALQGKVFLYETTLMPLSSRAGAEVVAAGKPKRQPSWTEFNIPPMKTRWQTVRDEHEAQMDKERKEEAEQQNKVATQAAALGENNGG